MIKKIRIIISIAGLFILLLSCTAGNTGSSWDLTSKKIDIIRATKPYMYPASAKNRGNTLVVGSTDFNGIFNPLFAETAYDVTVTTNIFGSLIEPDFDAKPIPGMADCKISDDGLTYTLTLKKGIIFSDGSPVSSKDVEFTLYVLCDPSYDGPIDVGSVNIVGYGDYHRGASESISGIKVIDNSTVEISLEKPDARAVWRFSEGVLSRDYYGAGFKKGKLDGIRSLMSKPMGAGPYKLSEFKPGQSVTLTANEHYYKGAPKIGEIVYSVTQPGQELDRIISGETDIDFPPVNSQNIQNAAAHGFIDIYRYPTNGYGYVGFNTKDARYSDKRVRQALLTAIDRKTVVNSVYGRYADVINIPQSKISWAYGEDGINQYSYDLDKASKLLADAGWIKDAGGKLSRNGQQFKITFYAIKGHPVTDVLIPAIKESYGKLGIDLATEYTDWPTLIDKVADKTIDMYFMAWGLTPDPDPSSIYQTNGSQNYFSYSNSKADDLMLQAIMMSDIAKRKDLYGQVYRILNDDVPCLWIYQRSDMWAVSGRVVNFRASPYRDWFYGIDQMSLSQ